MALLAPAHKLTAAEYLARYPESTQPRELINGEVFELPSPKPIHQRIVLKLSAILNQLVEAQQLGEILIAPCDVHLDAHNIVQPDILFIAKTNPRCRPAEDGYLHGPPDLCVEVISPGTVKRDRVDKYDLYARHGVREYWLIDAEARFIEIYVLAGATYHRQGAYTDQQSFGAALFPDLSIGLKDIFPPLE